MDIIEDCPITKQDSELVGAYGNIDDPNVFRTYVRVTGDRAYTPCCGAVIDVARSEEGLVEATVQYNADVCVRLGHLASASVSAGDAVTEGDLIGVAQGGLVDFYLLTPEENPQTRKFVVATLCLYAQEPTQILNRLVGFEPAAVYGEAEPLGNVEMQDELSNNRG